MKKTILLLCMLTFLCPTPIAASEISSTETTNIIVRADIKEWKYKFINGSINLLMVNYTKDFGIQLKDVGKPIGYLYKKAISLCSLF